MDHHTLLLTVFAILVVALVIWGHPFWAVVMALFAWAEH